MSKLSDDAYNIISLFSCFLFFTLLVCVQVFFLTINVHTGPAAASAVEWVILYKRSRIFTLILNSSLQLKLKPHTFIYIPPLLKFLLCIFISYKNAGGLALLYSLWCWLVGLDDRVNSIIHAIIYIIWMNEYAAYKACKL